jgi:adenine phosphoribosyltransferase
MIAAFIIFGDVEMTETAARALLDRAPDFDILMTAEAKKHSARL